MNGVIFPASPNWYCSRVSDCNEAGRFVFAAQNKLHVADFAGGDLKFSGSWETHVEKCCALSLCQIDGLSNLCCTCCEDGPVRVWDIDSRSILHEYDEHRDKVTAVHWSPVDGDLVLIGDDRGGVISWRLKTGEILIFMPEKGSVSALACSPHDAWHVAIGYKSGMVFVFDLHRNGSVLHHLRGHDEEILSIAWCPTLGEINPEETDISQETSGCLLATGSRDRTIKIWSTTTGNNIQTFSLPSNTGNRRERSEDGGRSRSWVTVSWPKLLPGNLLSSSHGGELLMWDVWKKSKQKWKVVDAQGEIRSHWRSIFNISAAKNYCFTISLDRQLCMWDLSQLKCIAARPTMGGFIYSMANSPVNPGNVALGVGDQIIRIWNVSQPANVNKITSLWQGIKSKVTALCWHPVQENLLAYGTDDGRVGVYDAFKMKPPIMAHTFHKGTVYALSFGPPCSAEGTQRFKTSHALYSCGDGIINQHNPSRLDTKAININEIIMKTNQNTHCLKRSEIRWKQDQSLAAVGNEDGSVEIYSVPDLKLLCMIQSTKKIVNTIQWHPEYTTDLGHEQSKLHTWIAIGSNDSSIHIVDVTNAIGDCSVFGTQHRTVTESTRVLTGHASRVTCLSWSIHREGMLASASYDRTVQVWNVLTNEPVGNYRGHNGFVFSVLWHPLEDDKVLSGGDDFTVQCWRPSELEEKVPPPKSLDAGENRTKKKKKKKGKGSKPQSVTVEKSPNFPVLGESLDEDSRNELMVMLEQKRLELAKSKDVDTEMHENGISGNTSVANVQKSHCGVANSGDAIHLEKPDDTPTDSHLAAGGVAPSSDAALLAERKRKLTEILGVVEEKPSEDSTEALLPKRDTRNLKVKKRRLLFPLSNELENLGKIRLVEDCVNIAYITLGSPPAELKELVDSGKLTHLGTFLDKKALYKMVTAESEHHLAHGHIETYFTLEIWRGNIAEMLKVAQDQNQLTDFLVTMASFSQHPMFLATCEAYATQLEKCENFLKATCYYLICFKVYEAIDMLMKNKLFKEAVILARLRLPRQDPIIHELYMTWANHLINELRTPEQAAKCYLALGKPEEAMELLSKRNDVVGFKNASKIAYICQKDDVGEEYARKMSQLCLQNYDWNSMTELIEKQAQLRDILLLGVIHKKLCQQLKKLNLLDGTLQECEEKIPNKAKPSLPEIFLSSDVTDSMIPFEPVVVNRQSYLHDILKTWYYQCGLKMEEAAIRELYDRISSLKPTLGELAHLTYRQGLVHVSSDLSLVVLAILLGDKTAALKHMLDAMVISYDQKLDKLLQGICNIVLPLGPEYISRFWQEVQAMKLTARYDGTINTAAGASIAEIGRQEIQQEAITAYYYWSVVNYTLQNLQTDECKREGGTRILKENAEKQTEGKVPPILEKNGEEDSSRTEPQVEDAQQGPSISLAFGDFKRSGTRRKSIVTVTSGASILDYITGIRIESLFQVLLHKVQSRRFMCTEKLSYIESAIKLLRERTKDTDIDQSMNQTPMPLLPPITPRTPIPSVCIDDGDTDGAEVREPSPDSVELQIAGSNSGDLACADSMQVVYKKSDISSLDIGVAGSSQNNGPSCSKDLNMSLDASAPGISLPLEGVKELSPFSHPKGPDDSVVGASPEVEAEDDYVEMNKLRAWASARKRQSDFALMMFKDCNNYDNVPSEWYTMPASERYTQDCVTMEILVNEKDQVSKQLEEVAFFVKDVHFPNPHKSSKVMLDICQNLRTVHRKDVSTYIETITAWIKENGVTREHLNWIDQKPEQVD